MSPILLPPATAVSPSAAGRAEPLAIQPQGAVIVLDAKLQKVRHVSTNLAEVVQVSPDHALAHSARALLGARLLASLRRELNDRTTLSGALLIQRKLAHGTQRLQVYAYRSGGHTVIELEPLLQSAGKRLLPSVNAWLTRLASATQAQTVLSILVRGVRSLTGHERCLIYQFDDDGNADVTAEDLAPGATSLLGHRFPARHLPAMARTSYLSNPVRSLPDTRAAPVPLVPALATDALDMEPGALRAMTPAHRVYLDALGVGASLSVALRGEQHVWGLLACHSTQAHPLSPALREAAWTLVEMAAQRLFLLQARAEAAFLERVADSRDLLSTARGELHDPEALVNRHGHQWLQLFRADGIAFLHGKHHVTLGKAPRLAVLRRLEDWLQAHVATTGFWAGRSRHEGPLAHEPDLDGCAGLLAVALPVEPARPGWLLLFRPEVRHTLRWAGYRDDHHTGLACQQRPAVLASWSEDIQGQAEPWLPIEQRAARDLGEDLAVAAAAHRIQLLNQHLAEERQRLAALNLKLEKQAHTDPLTGIWNRYRIEQALDAEMAAAERYGRPCTVLLFDIDHFKRVNDTHGHDTGDQVLSALAEALQNQRRPSDHFGRWGGEEFIVVLSDTALADGLQVAERMREHLAQQHFPVVQHLTTSVGVATWRPDDTRRSLVDRADQALYRAKRHGRNRVCAEANTESGQPGIL